MVVVTHGDLLSLNDRARVRVHLGELLGIPPAKQIFDIPGDPIWFFDSFLLCHNWPFLWNNCIYFYLSVGLSNKDLWRFNHNHFLLAESHDPVTELTIVNMLHYSLEHADKNLPHKRQIAKKVWFISIISALLFFLIGSFHKHSTVETSIFSFEWQWFVIRVSLPEMSTWKVCGMVSRSL